MIDVGANVGLYSVPAGCHGAVVIAFEPVERAASIAERNMSRNRVDGCVHRVAIADRSGVTAMSDGDVEAHIDPAGGERIVPLARLDDFEIGSADGISILKIDTEGYDEAVLRGASAFLHRERPVILCEISNGGLAVRQLLGRQTGISSSTTTGDGAVSWRTRGRRAGTC